MKPSLLTLPIFAEIGEDFGFDFSHFLLNSLDLMVLIFCSPFFCSPFAVKTGCKPFLSLKNHFWGIFNFFFYTCVLLLEVLYTVNSWSRKHQCYFQPIFLTSGFSGASFPSICPHWGFPRSRFLMHHLFF